MKNTILFLCIGLLTLSSCRQTCSCYHTCSTFNNGAITICNSSYTEYQYLMLRDSLTRQYGSRHDTTYDNIGVNGTQTGGVVNQLEAQGYFCDCTNPI